MSEIKLKPCPFCGEEAELVEYAYGDGLHFAYVPRCLNRECMCELLPYWNDEAAANAWNTRENEMTE